MRLEGHWWLATSAAPPQFAWFAEIPLIWLAKPLQVAGSVVVGFDSGTMNVIRRAADLGSRPRLLPAIHHAPYTQGGVKCDLVFYTRLRLR